MIMTAGHPTYNTLTDVLSALSISTPYPTSPLQVATVEDVSRQPSLTSA